MHWESVPRFQNLESCYISGPKIFLEWNGGNWRSLQYLLTFTSVFCKLRTFPCLILIYSWTGKEKNLWIWRRCLKTCMLRAVQFFVTPWGVAQQAPLSMNFPGENPGVGSISSSRGSSQSRDWSWVSYVSCTGSKFFTTTSAGKIWKRGRSYTTQTVIPRLQVWVFFKTKGGSAATSSLAHPTVWWTSMWFTWCCSAVAVFRSVLGCAGSKS